jgi:hypothetical protein
MNVKWSVDKKSAQLTPIYLAALLFPLCSIWDIYQLNRMLGWSHSAVLEVFGNKD